MEKNVDELARARNAARGAMRAERDARRRDMAIVAEGRGRLSRRVGALLLDESIFEDWVAEKGRKLEGGDYEGRFMRWFCAQVASGVSAGVLCDEYCVDRGLLGAFVSEVPERLEMYQRAQMWAAEGLIDDGLEAAWSDNPDVVRDKLRFDASFKVAGKWNRARYGEEKQQGVGGVPIFNVIMPGAVVPEGGAELPPLIQAED